MLICLSVRKLPALPYIASFPGLQSPNAVVKLLHRMTSGRRWVYIWVDVGRRGTSGEVQSAAR